ncbi:hypothetical protein EVAR_20829_1 [Eumeta japonica]|uniref:Uncharacterized protein n=1 Tax=Eumeta variegata TaxID=151549 RepID=A0A4C1UDI7_EUMVA|nr:hypothetical protein EVAR_20829_1 [Eumeta japonica]
MIKKNAQQIGLLFCRPAKHPPFARAKTMANKELATELETGLARIRNVWDHAKWRSYERTRKRAERSDSRRRVSRGLRYDLWNKKLNPERRAADQFPA